MDEGKMSLAKMKERRRKEEVMMHDHPWSIQQCDRHEYDNAHDDYENAKIQEAQMQHDNDGHGNAI